MQISITTEDQRNFCFTPKTREEMSTSKRKHSTPPPPSSSPSKKRKHKHSKSSATEQLPKSPVSESPQLFQKSRLKIHVAVPPAASTFLDTYINIHLTSVLLLKHTANGTIVAFSGFKSLSGVGRILDECPFSWAWFEGDVVLFNPLIGQRIRTYLTKNRTEYRRDCDVEFTGSCSFNYVRIV
jgi:hypothetical protein